MSEFNNHDLISIKLPDHSNNSRHYHHSSKHSHIQQSVTNWREKRGHSGSHYGHYRKYSLPSNTILKKTFSKFILRTSQIYCKKEMFHFYLFQINETKKCSIFLFSKLATFLNNLENYPLSLCCGEMSQYLNFVFTSQLSD